MIFDKNNLEIKTLNEHINFNGKKILEFCCGESMYANRLPQTYESYLGIDINKNAIDNSKKQCENSKAKYVCSSVLDFNSQEKYDISIGTLALHEIEIKEQGLAFNKLIELTNNGGLVVVLDPELNKSSFQELWNVVYRHFISFEHDYTVQNSLLVIENAIRNGLVVKELEKEVNLPIEIENMQEVYDMFLDCEDFKDIFKAQKKIEELKKVVTSFFNENKINDIIYDKLKLTILRKNENACNN